MVTSGGEREAHRVWTHDIKQSLQETKDKESQRPRLCLCSLPQSLCCPAIIHLHIDLQQITGVL